MIVVIDFGSQLAHLITRRLKDIGVEAELVAPENVLSTIKEKQPKGIVLSGGPASVYEAGSFTVDPKMFESGLPILGICYGWQLMAKLLGGEVKSSHKEYGVHTLNWNNDKTATVASPFISFKDKSQVVMSHGDTVTALPDGFQIFGSTDQVAFAAVGNTEKKWYGVQFHPEADHTEGGSSIYQAFASICGELLEKMVIDPGLMIESIRQTVGTDRVLCAVSGGVDSTVAAMLIAKAIGKQLIPVYIESGLMRTGTREQVEMMFRDVIGVPVCVIEAQDRFMKTLKNSTDPEIKRKAIGKLYVDLFQEKSQTFTDVKFLGQGTIYSDVIESKGSKNAAYIKAHHNVGGLPESLHLQLLEPIRHLYKDQVRQLGRLLGLPDDLVSMQPFPGPGYAVRIRGEVTLKRLAQAKQADTIVMEEMKAADLWAQVFQCFAVMTGANSTAVKGDGRVFAEVVAIRAYESKDIMTSQWARIPFEVLNRMAQRIVNEVPDVSRVVYDITSKPPATMEWE